MTAGAPRGLHLGVMQLFPDLLFYLAGYHKAYSPASPVRHWTRYLSRRLFVGSDCLPHFSRRSRSLRLPGNRQRTRSTRRHPLFGSILWILAGAVRQYSNIQDSLDVSACLGCVGSITAILLNSVSDFNHHIPANALVFAAVLALASSTVHTREMINGHLFLSERDGSSSLSGSPNPNRSERRTMRRASRSRVY